MNKTIIKINASVIRQAQKEQGFFDGRFNTKSVPSKKLYKRKVKHKLLEEE